MAFWSNYYIHILFIFSNWRIFQIGEAIVTWFRRTSCDLPTHFLGKRRKKVRLCPRLLLRWRAAAEQGVSNVRRRGDILQPWEKHLLQAYKQVDAVYVLCWHLLALFLFLIEGMWHVATYCSLKQLTTLCCRIEKQQKFMKKSSNMQQQSVSEKAWPHDPRSKPQVWTSLHVF